MKTGAVTPESTRKFTKKAPIMANITAAKPTTEERAHAAFHRVMESAPMGLLICAALGLAIIGGFQYLFYFFILPASWGFTLTAAFSASVAVFFEALGFFFLVATVRDFSAGAKREGWLGLSGTILLFAYTLWECTHIAATFDRETPESWWAMFGIVGTIGTIVRLVEFRIALTVASSVQRKNALAEAETTIADERKRNLELTGKLYRFEEAERTEKQRLQAENEQREKQRVEQEGRDRQQAWDALQQEATEARQEAERLRRAAARAEKAPAGITVTNTGRAEMERKAADFYKRNKITPTQQQVAEMVGLKDAKSVRNQFPNGSWDDFLEGLEAEMIALQY